MNLFNRWLYGVLMLGALGIGITSLLPAEEKADSITGELMKNLKNCQKEVEDIRGKKFKADVPIETRSREDFIKWARDKAKSLAEEVEAIRTNGALKESALTKLGLIPRSKEGKEIDEQNTPDDLIAQEANAIYDEAAACYDPEAKKVYLHRVSTKTLMEAKIALTHELCHALDDQYSDWNTLIKNAGASEDALIAFKFLQEGTATYLMAYHGVQSMMGKGTSITQFLRETAISQLVSYSIEDILNMERKKGQPPILRLDPKTESRYLYWCKYAPYTLGMVSIADMMELSVPGDKGVSITGWTAVDLAWAKPPVSTEQMLHPYKLLVKRDDPTPVDQPKLPNGWEVVYSNTLGEFGFRILFETFEFKKQKCLDFAKGWDGDRYTLIKNTKNNRFSLHFATVWDRESDALESFKAYQQVVSKKYPGGQTGKTDNPDSEFTWTSPDNKLVILMFRDGAKWTAVEDVPVEGMEVWQKTPPKKD